MHVEALGLRLPTEWVLGSIYPIPRESMYPIILGTSVLGNRNYSTGFGSVYDYYVPGPFGIVT